MQDEQLAGQLGAYKEENKNKKIAVGEYLTSAYCVDFSRI
jgi:hypothetical protein